MPKTSREARTRSSDKSRSRLVLTCSQVQAPELSETFSIEFKYKLSAVEHHETNGLIEISLERASSADVQGNAMRPPAQHLGVPQFQGDYIKSLLF